MTDLLLQRLAAFFDENDTAASFLSEDGDGGYVAAVARMTREIERLRKAEIAERNLQSQLRPPGSVDAPVSGGNEK